MLETIELCATDQPDASVIWLHGLGASGEDFVPIVEELALPCAVRFVFPHAPAMPVTVNGGYLMRAWYDIFTMDIAGQQDEAGIRASQTQLETLIEQEQERGIAPARIVLAGFSQGGAIVLQTALRHRQRLGGVMALSTYLPLHASLLTERSPANRDLPIFLVHGSYDNVIPASVAHKSKALLETQGYPLEWHEYPMGHTVCEAEVQDIRRFLLRVLG